MDLGGLQRTTLSNFPGRVACTVFTAGCPLRCPYCHNPELIDGESSLSEAAFFAFLDERRDVLDGVVVSGGEPTLQDNLVRFVTAIADRGFDVKLDTNGTRPDVLATLLDTGAVDYVAMDLKTLPERYDELGGEQVADAVERSARIVRERAPEFEFRTTFDPGLVRAEDFERLADLAGAGPLYIQPVETESVLDPEAVEPTPAKPRAAVGHAVGYCPDSIAVRESDR